MVNKKIIDDYQQNVERSEQQEDFMNESEYINNNLQLIEKEIEPHSKEFFEIINRDLQLGNIRQGGMMYMITLESYHRSLTYTKELKQKMPKSKTYTYRIVDPFFVIPDNFNWEDHEQVKKIPTIEVTQEIKYDPVIVKKLYQDTKTGKIIEKEEQIKTIDFLKPHILNSPMERGSHFIIVSNSVEGFLRKNRRTISREVNAKTTDSIEAGKPVIIKKNGNDYSNYGGSW